MYGLHWLVLASAAALAAPPGAAEFAWMEGRWTTEKWGGPMEEVWSRPLGNTVMGMFRLVKDGKPSFYEFMTIEAGESGTYFYLRHFYGKSVAWEDKAAPVVFSVVRASAQAREAVFERTTSDTGERTRLSYRLDGEDRLIAVLEKEKAGQTSREEFVYRRAR